MATKYHNLSDYNPNELPNADVLARQRYAIVVADWNSDITFALLEGAIETFIKAGVKEENIDIIHVPGTVELTYAAAKVIKRGIPFTTEEINLACEDKLEYNLYLSAVIVIGCVIQGDTPHFDYVCQSVTQGVTILNAKADVPIIFSVLTTLDKQQALDRCGGIHGNKGVEGAFTAMKMANL